LGPAGNHRFALGQAKYQGRDEAADQGAEKEPSRSRR
jgi:hypothetical protein